MIVPLETFSQHVGLLICYYITFSFWSAQTLSLSLISRNIAGQTKKSVAIALNFIIWAVGNAIGKSVPVCSLLCLTDRVCLPAGPQVFLDWDGPRYFIAFATHLGCYGLLVVDIVLLRWYLVAQNKKRDRLAAEGVQEARDEAFVHAFEDITDKKNPNFRYVY
jgi:hypothetical protein